MTSTYILSKQHSQSLRKFGAFYINLGNQAFLEQIATKSPGDRFSKPSTSHSSASGEKGHLSTIKQHKSLKRQANHAGFVEGEKVCKKKMQKEMLAKLISKANLNIK